MRSTEVYNLSAHVTYVGMRAGSSWQERARWGEMYQSWNGTVGYWTRHRRRNIMNYRTQVLREARR